MALAKNPFLRGIESQTDGDAPTLHADPGPLEALPMIAKPTAMLGLCPIPVMLALIVGSANKSMIQ